MAVNYDEKILSTFGKRTVKSASPEEPDTIEDGVFVVDPNKIVTEDDTIIPRYVKQEDLVMYANITARLNPDNAIIDDGGESTKTITIGSVGVNFLNPLAKAPKDVLGNIQFGDKKNKDYFTTEWSDYFTSNADQGTFFDPETFGISNIDVTHNASLTPIIKVEFIDVQGRTLLERGDDPANPYNIFYRFPYPLFTLTIKGYFGKAIEYPLSMTKTSTTFDASTGNYVIRAEFLSRTFSVYNNFLMVYAYAAPYMYERTDVPGSYLGKRLLKALYQKQNAAYMEKYGADSIEYKKHEFIKYPSILDLTRAQSVLGYETLNVGEKLTEIAANKEKALSSYGQLDTAYNNGMAQVKSEQAWDGGYLEKNNNDRYYLKNETIEFLKSDLLTDLSMDSFPDVYTIFGDYVTVLNDMSMGESPISPELRKAVYDAIIANPNLPEGYKISVKYEQILETSGVGGLGALLNEELILMYYTDSNDETELSKIYFTPIYFTELNKIISKVVSEFYDREENAVIDNLGFSLKDNLGYVPNMSNVLRILMNNMQIFLTMLNLVALNASKQISDSSDRRDNQERFGEYEIDNSSPGLKRFFPFPNYFKKRFDTDAEDFVWEKTYPWTYNTVNWFEVQFVEEIYKAIDRLLALEGKIDSQSDEDVQFLIEQSKKIRAEVVNDKKIALLTTLLVVNNLEFYNDQQTPRETALEFIEKVLLFSTLGYINTAGDSTKINDITKLFVDHEFDLVERRYSNKEPNDLNTFYSDLGVFIGNVGSEEYPTNYDKICSELVNGDAIVGGSPITISTNNIAVVNNINNLLPELRSVVASNYTIDQLKDVYAKIDNVVNSATDINEFRKLYQYNPLRYKNRKNTTTSVVRSLFFDGLDAHDQYDGFSDTLNEYGAKLQSYKKTSLVSANNGYLYPLNTENTDVLNFIVNGRIDANDTNSTPLTFALKTDDLLKESKLGVGFGGLILDSSKKITTGTKYSKVRI
jgi:hypothetical protein